MDLVRLRMANLTSMSVGAAPWTFSLSAANGGLVDVPNLATVTSSGAYLGLSSTGTSSVVNVPNLDLSSPALQKAVTVGSGGTINWGSPTAFPYGTLSLQGAGTINLQNLTDVDKSLFSATSGALLSLPGVTAYSSDPNASNENIFSASGTGSITRLTNLTSINLAATYWTFSLSATSGGLVDVPNLATVSSNGAYLGLSSTGTNSVINVPSLNLSSPTLQKVVTVGSGGTIDWGSPTSFPYGTLTVQGAGTINLQNLTKVDKSLFSATSGGLLSLPGVTAYSSDPNASNENIFSADGTGSIMRLANLTSINLAATYWTFSLSATSGGLVDVPNLTTVSTNGAYLGLTSTGTSSVVNVPELDVSSPSLQKFVTVGTGGTINWGSPTTFAYGTLTMQGAGTINVQSLTDVDKSLFSAISGALLSLPGVTAYSSDPNAVGGTFMKADGAGSIMRMANLTSINLAATFWTLSLSATNGGLVDAPNLTRLTSSGEYLGMTAQGSNSVVNVSSLRSTVGVPNDNFNISSNGRINIGACQGDMVLNCRLMFASTSGSLEIFYGNTLLDTISPSQQNTWQTIHLDLGTVPYDPSVGLGFVANGSSANIDFNDYQVTPEPGTMTFLLVGMLAIPRRRK